MLLQGMQVHTWQPLTIEERNGCSLAFTNWSVVQVEEGAMLAAVTLCQGQTITPIICQGEFKVQVRPLK